MTDNESILRQENATLKEERDTLREQYEASQRAYQALMHQVKEMLRDRFGSKSERYIDPDNPQLSFAEEFLSDGDSLALQELSDHDAPFSDDNVVDIKGHKRSKKANKRFPDHLPRQEVIIPVSEHDKTCSCGCRKRVISHERHERLHYQPPVYEVVVEMRETVACIRGCPGEIKTADKPKHILPKAKFTESVLAHIIVSKLDDRQPFYHLEKQFESRSGFTLSRQTMAKSTIECVPALQPLFNLMKDRIIEYDIGALDATTFQVLNEPGRSPTTKSYAYCMRGGPPDQSVILYEYNYKAHKLFLRDWFEGFGGVLHCDADPFFELLFAQEEVSPSFCNAHARRKFEPIVKATKSSGLAKKAMAYYRKLYRIERKAKEDGMSAEERLALRQQYSAPLMEEIKAWLDQVYPTVAPKSPIGKALHYAIKHWTGLCAFLKDGRLEVDNNLTEQEIKPFVIARKNFLFANSVSGAQALCLHFSLIRTAKCHGLDPYRYYNVILRRVPHCTTVADYEALLPWNIDLERVSKKNLAA